MDKLAQLNSFLVEQFPPGIKITLSQLPLQDYSLLISFALSIIGFALLICVIRWKPPVKIPEGLKKKRQ
ncbi:unnamed protein product [Blepharisma stoltei]|uniref:ATP synthase F0 subunit 8 n=1 Tax=Blepharisma stoltei TaxID=1481888 RepID=A0AAU9IU50_9CILI|nr:unnamed protein product [Blepharisma stoltei]